jgi:methyl-accepting chemotaxis protein
MKWTIGRKLGGLCLMMIVVLILLGTISYHNVISSIENAELVEHTYRIFTHNHSLQTCVWEAEGSLRGYFLTGQEEYLQQHREAVTSLNKKLDELKKSIRLERSQQYIAAMETVLSKRLLAFEEVSRIYRERRTAGATEYMKTNNPQRLTRELIGIIGEYEQFLSGLLRERQKDLEASNARLRNLILFGIPLALLVITIAGYLLTRSITRPLNQLTQAAEGISRGDLSHRPVVGERGDEVGILAAAFARMGDYLQEMSGVAQSLAANDLTVTCTPHSPRDSLGNAFSAMISNLRTMGCELQDAALMIGSSATQIAAMSAQLAASSAETAAAVNETSTTVEEIKMTAQLVNQKSLFVADSANNTSQISQAGRRSVDETMAGMDKIRRQMDFVAESIVRLSEQSMAIGEIIATVGDLASQSNLLAVNASIEAAKAGDQGKGFAVVAHEVRSLAEQSKSATEQVRRILNDIQKAISAAVMATEQGGKTVEAGVRQTSETADAIQAMEEGAAGTVQAASQIKASTNEQVAGLNQVAQAMDNIRSASEQIVLSTRQAEESTAALSEMGKRLKGLVERFKVS